MYACKLIDQYVFTVSSSYCGTSSTFCPFRGFYQTREDRAEGVVPPITSAGERNGHTNQSSLMQVNTVNNGWLEAITTGRQSKDEVMFDLTPGENVRCVCPFYNAELRIMVAKAEDQLCQVIVRQPRTTDLPAGFSLVNALCAPIVIDQNRPFRTAMPYKLALRAINLLEEEKRDAWQAVLIKLILGDSVWATVEYLEWSRMEGVDDGCPLCTVRLNSFGTYMVVLLSTTFLARHGKKVGPQHHQRLQVTSNDELACCEPTTDRPYLIFPTRSHPWVKTAPLGSEGDAATGGQGGAGQDQNSLPLMVQETRRGRGGGGDRRGWDGDDPDGGDEPGSGGSPPPHFVNPPVHVGPLRVDIRVMVLIDKRPLPARFQDQLEIIQCYMPARHSRLCEVIESSFSVSVYQHKVVFFTQSTLLLGSCAPPPLPSPHKTPEVLLPLNSS